VIRRAIAALPGAALIAAALAAAVPATGAPAAAAPPASAAPVAARTQVVDLGGPREYVRADEGASLAGVELVVRAGLDRQSASQNGLAALVAESVLHTQAGAPPLALSDAVDARGASIGYAVGTSSVRFYLEGTPEAIAAAAPLVASALAAPSFDATTLTAARAALADRLGDEESDPRLVGRAMLRSSYYRGGAGLPALGDAGALAAITAADAKAFYDRWYLRGGATVAAVGRTGAATDAASRALVAALPAGTAPAATITVRAPAAQPKRIVTHRDVAAPYVVLGFAAPALGDRDFPAALVVRSLLGSVFDRPAATTLPPAFRAVGAIYGYDTAPGQLIVWINGARIDAETGLTSVDAVVKAAAAKPLSATVLNRYKESARGEWTLESVSLDERAGAIANAVTRGLDPDVADEVRAAIGRVTAADVQRVAKKYFQRFDVALVMPRSAGS
jgi:zinc protease